MRLQAVCVPNPLHARVADAERLGQRAGTPVMALAVEWCNNGLITAGARDEITTIVRMAPFLDWRPLLFIIPYACVSDRVREAPREKRASTEREFIVPDLKRDEFDIIELAL
jgi:hypothetical protein